MLSPFSKINSFTASRMSLRHEYNFTGVLKRFRLMNHYWPSWISRKVSPGSLYKFKSGGRKNGRVSISESSEGCRNRLRGVDDVRESHQIQAVRSVSKRSL